MTVKHSFVSAKPDSADATIASSSEWNADHVIDAAGLVIGSDVNLYRSGANVLTTDDIVQVNRPLVGDYALATHVAAEGNYRLILTADGNLNWGTGSAAADTIIRRTGAGVLNITSTGTTDVRVEAATGVSTNVARVQAAGASAGAAWFEAIRAGDTQPRMTISDTGLSLGPGGSTSPDATLSRSGAGFFVAQHSIHANTYLEAGNIITANHNVANKAVQIGTSDGGGTTGPGITFNLDANLYRSAAGVLATDDTFLIGSGGSLRQGGTSFPGSPSDGDLYYRTDHHRWFRYHTSSVKWLTEPVFVPLVGNVTATATTSSWARAVVPIVFSGMATIYISRVTFSAQVVNAQTGANYWTLSVIRSTNSGTTSAVGSVNTQAQTTANRWGTYSAEVSALVSVPTNAANFEVNIATTGTPGNLVAMGGVFIQGAL